MADHIGQITIDPLQSLYAGHQTINGPARWVAYAGNLPFDLVSSLWVYSYPPSPMYIANYAGGLGFTLGDFWFEIIHVFPRLIDAGMILTTQTFALEIFNADRWLDHTLLTFDNNAGDGIFITDLPTLPYTLLSLESLSLTLQITPQGPPVIIGTLDFESDLYIIGIPITGSRIVLFPFRPEEPLHEQLEFLTQVMPSINGKEQRVALRKNPRQIFEMEILKQKPHRQAIEMLLFDWQSRMFGVPVWFEPMNLTVTAAAADLTINVNTTNYADVRVGGLVVVLQAYNKYDALLVASYTATTITFESGLVNSYAVGVEVYPVRKCLSEAILRGEKNLVDVESFTIRFRVADNDSNLASITGWNTFNSKVILDDSNFIEGVLAESLEKSSMMIDNETGLFSQDSLWPSNKRSSVKTFIVDTRVNLWKVRCLLHYLKGQQISFYLPTFYEEMTPTVTLPNGGATITMTNIGYSKFIRNRNPKARIRIHLLNGTVLDRTIQSSSEIDYQTEQLTVNTVWPYDILVANIKRIEFIELVRMSDDAIKIIHENSYGTAQITLPVKAVFDE